MSARDKNEYFKAGWPYLSPFLTGLPLATREHLQLGNEGPSCTTNLTFFFLGMILVFWTSL
jgi:hypothetical protein